MCNQKDYNFFLKEKNLSEYSGKWIAICNQKIICSDLKSETLIKKSKKVCKTKPLFVKIPKKDLALIL